MMAGRGAIALLLIVVVGFTSALPWREPVGRKSSLSTASTLKWPSARVAAGLLAKMLGGDAHRSVSGLSTRATSMLTSDRIDRIATVELYEIVIEPHIELVGIRKIDARRALFKNNRFAATKRSFSGQVTMHFTMTQRSNFLPLRSKNLDILNITLHDANGKELDVNSFDQDEKTTQATLTPKQPFEQNAKYSVYFNYTGEIKPPQSTGLYYDSYMAEVSASHSTINDAYRRRY